MLCCGCPGLEAVGLGRVGVMQVRLTRGGGGGSWRVTGRCGGVLDWCAGGGGDGVRSCYAVDVLGLKLLVLAGWG